MKILLSALLLSWSVVGFGQIDEGEPCRIWKQSKLVSTITSNVVFSDDKRLIASYDYLEQQKKALFRLWDANTGKLLRTNTLANYEERSVQTSLRFSPNERFVYLQGMSYPADGSQPYGSVPFWNIQTNQLVFSPCATAMGVSTVRFNHDQTVAYTHTVDDYVSLCSTSEAKVFASVFQPSDLVKKEKLFETFADKNYQYFHHLSDQANLKQLQDKKLLQLYDYSPTNAKQASVKQTPVKQDASLAKLPSATSTKSPKQIKSVAVRDEQLIPSWIRNDTNSDDFYSVYALGEYRIFAEVKEQPKAEARYLAYKNNDDRLHYCKY